MKRSELTVFAVEEEGFKLKIRRGTNGLPVVSQSGPAASPAPVAAPVASASAAPSAPASAAPAAPATGDANAVYIKSPMVGTFYCSATPDGKPYVEPGAKFTETSVVCIIEAMKIMNEIQAETKGSILEVLVENGQPVEFGQPLFKIKQG